MAVREVIFFATLSDIQPTLEQMEDEFSIQYYEMGLFDSKIIPSYDTVFSIPNLGTPPIGNWIQDRRLLMIPANATLIIRDIPQRKGGIKYLVDQENNLNCCWMQLGGIYKDGVIIPGSFYSIFQHEFSIGLYKCFSRFKKHFIKIGHAYVGKNAYEKLRQGWRLVTNEFNPLETDLRL